jgi:hypothetical protein
VKAAPLQATVVVIYPIVICDRSRPGMLIHRYTKVWPCASLQFANRVAYIVLPTHDMYLGMVFQLKVP